jgi:hypothetical protein
MRKDVQPSTTEVSLNKKSSSFSWRFICGIIHFTSILGWIIAIAFIGTGVKVIYTSASEWYGGITRHYWADRWPLVAIGLIAAGLVIAVVSSFLIGKFKPEEDTTDVSSLSRP